MNCPVCDVPLKMSERQGIEIDYCPQCRGVWLDRGELDKIIDRSATFETPPARATAPTKSDYFDDDVAKRKRGYDDDYYDDRRDRDRRSDPRYKKRKSMLGELFDIFD